MPVAVRGPRLSARRRNALALLSAVAVLGSCYAVIPGVRLEVDRAVAVMAGADIQEIRRYFLSFGLWSPVASAGLMVLHSVLPFLPSFPITIANGLLFGVLWGVLLTWAASMVSGAITYWITDALGRPIVERVVSGKALEAANRFLGRYGNRGVFVARLVPGLPFDVVGYAAGLAETPFWGYMLATAVGNLPGTILLAVAGANLAKGRLFLWITIGLVLGVGILGLLFRKFVGRMFSETRGKDVKSK